MNTKNKLTDSPKLRALRLAAYRSDRYAFNPPPVYSGGWSEQAWMNWVHFENSELTGFLPYVKNPAYGSGSP
jgi:hypothetical protein